MALRVRTEWTGVTGTPYLSTHYFLNAASQVNADAAIAAVAGFWGDLQGVITTSLSWATLPLVEEIGMSGQLISIIGTTPASGAGTSGSDMLPRASQGLISWRTGSIVAGREVRGRTFVPGPTEAQNDAGPVSSYMNTLNTAAANLIADGDTDFCILSITHGQVRSVVAGVAWNSFAVQRSRRD